MTQTVQPQVDNEVAIAHYSSYDTRYQFGYTVTKITKTGQVVVTRGSDGHERRFDKNGYEMGRPSYNRDLVIFDIEPIRQEVELRRLTRNAADAVSAVMIDVSRNSDKAYLEGLMVGLEQKMAEARALIALIPDSK